MGFWEAKHGLKSKLWIRANLVSIFEGAKTVKREEKGKRRRRREEKKKKRREEEVKNKKVWNYEFLYGIPKFCMNFHAIGWLVACPQT